MNKNGNENEKQEERRKMKQRTEASSGRNGNIVDKALENWRIGELDWDGGRLGWRMG
jgi:hypothetical protein